MIVEYKRMRLISCWVVENETNRLVPLDDVCRFVGTTEWLDEFWRKDEERKVALMLGKGGRGHM